MKTYQKLLLIILTFAFAPVVYGQTAKELTDEGVKLFDNGKYDDAIAKYKEAIKTDAKYANAYYEIGYTYFSTNKPLEAIPYLETTIKLLPNSGGAYDMLGSIYDDNNQTAKGIEYYLKGISVDPNYQRLYYNLGLTYYRKKEYELAEERMIKAIMLEPKHASSHKMYASIMYEQGKKGKALLGWSSFLLLEPNSKRSVAALKELNNIINYGIARVGDKVSMSVSNKELKGPDFIIPATVIAATADQRGLTRADSLTLQLTKLYSVADMFTGQTADPFFKAYFADYFKKLASTDNMPAFARYISLMDNNEQKVAWFKEHNETLTKLDKWLNGTERKFN
ncbi:tetratricopeptide repeat protein [Mucilaginibacter lutimaris]|uniref:Tetratricopeptide repeat protein n=1 Tax=Mucilaginibacter lutimaris TaxID=931629 RepID=A0ABW2ZKP2_9SPHI